jgi:hypothetical protein
MSFGTEPLVEQSVKLILTKGYEPMVRTRRSFSQDSNQVERELEGSKTLAQIVRGI